MRILVITREFPPEVIGGMGYHLGYLYSEIAKSGHDVTVLAGVCRESRNIDDSLVNENITTNWVEYGTFHGHHLWYSIALYNAVRDIDVKEFDVALTHTHIPFELPIPTIQKYHDCTRKQRPFFRKNMSPIKKAVDSVLDPTRRIVESRSIQHLSHAIFNSHLCHKAWAAHYDIDTSITIIHNGVDIDKFYPRDSNIDEEYTLFVGDSHRKGLSSVKQYASSSQEPVYLVGSSHVDHPNIKACGRVTQETLAELYSGAIATIHPARFEAFGNVVLESLACGTPVVVSDQCGASEIVEKNCGVVTTDIAQGVEYIRNMAKEECRKTATKYKWEYIADNTINVITDIVS